MASLCVCTVLRVAVYACVGEVCKYTGFVCRGVSTHVCRCDLELWRCP